MRSVLFFGNCQAEVLADIYRDHFAAELGDQVDFVPSIKGKPELHRDRIEQADIIVEQIFDFKPRIVPGDFRTKAHVVQFPCVSGAFLWPFMGKAHPRNSESYFLPDGPYPEEMSDQFLNDAIERGVSPAAAAKAYLDLDIVAARRLDERYRIVLRRQRQLDARAQANAADLIKARFRDAYLFATPYHPNSELLRLLAIEVAEKLGVGSERMDRFKRRFLRCAVHDEWLPIHPVVAKHFGLKYISADHRYRSLEGSFTFTQWVERYMRYESNEALAEGVFLARKSAPEQPPEGAIEKIRIGLLHSPDSPRGHGELAEALARADQLEAATASVRRAIELEPDFHELLGHYLARQGDLEGAVAAFREAVARRPNDPFVLIWLSHALFALTLLEEAASAATQALELRRGNAEWVQHLYKLAEALARAGHLESATATARRAIELDPDGPEFHELFGHFLAQQGDLEGAAAAFGDAVARKPGDPSLLISLSQALSALARSEEAIAAARQAVEMSPRNAGSLLHIGNLHAQQGELREAEQAFRASLELDRGSIDAQIRLAHILFAQGRRDQALMQLREAIARDPENPQLTALLAGLASERQAAAHSEPHPMELLAIAQTREALARDPGNPRLSALLASLTSERRGLGAASRPIGEFRTLSGEQAELRRGPLVESRCGRLPPLGQSAMPCLRSSFASIAEELQETA